MSEAASRPTYTYILYYVIYGRLSSRILLLLALSPNLEFDTLFVLIVFYCMHQVSYPLLLLFTVFICTAQHTTAHYSTLQHTTAQRRTAQPYTKLHYDALQDTALLAVVLYHTLLHYTAIHCSALH